MSHPRAVYPPEISDHYRRHGGKATCSAYQTSWHSLRRWLREHGVEIRQQGLRLGMHAKTEAERRAQQRWYDNTWSARNREKKRAAFRRWYYANRERAIQRVIDQRKRQAGAA